MAILIKNFEEHSKDPEKLFTTLIASAEEYAHICMAKGKEIDGTITGISADGIGFSVMTQWPEGRKQEWFRGLKEKFNKEKCKVGILFAEAWTVKESVGEDEANAIKSFLENGGSLEFWPDRIEVFFVEVFDGDHYQKNIYFMDREKAELTLDVDKVTNFTAYPIENIEIQSNLTRLLS